MAKKTTHWRINKELAKELKVSFPNVKQPDLINMMYNTSLLKAEKMLKEKDFKDKLGRFLYGNTWK